MKVEFEIPEHKENQHKLVRFLRIFAEMLLAGWDVTIVEAKIDGEDVVLY